LAAGILLASALGIVLGVELVFPGPGLPEHGAGGGGDGLSLAADVAVAGVVTCGFAVFYNTAWAQVALAAVGGMAGHGLRYLGLRAGCTPEAAAFLGGLAVGIVSAWMVRRSKAPVAVIAFAGAVTMMPGLQMYRALGGALQLARQAGDTESAAVAATLANALQAGIVVSGLALGVIIGARALAALAGERDRRRAPAPAKTPTEAPPRAVAEQVAR
jgi:uncharacterized membrane protein YjjB (DUF3815 family)